MIGTIPELIVYASARGQSIEDTEGGVALVKANDYLSGLCWIGSPVDEDQDDPFPRIIKGQQVETPKKVITAAYRLAMASAEGVELEQITEGGAQVIEERVEGAITMKYAEATIGSAASFPWLESLVGTWVDDSCGQNSLACNVSVRRG
ncbi:putative head-tail adaptor [Escherichia phage KW1E_UTAR]|nr:putative head-tail adaptor [Escherichia phage KW1E_UTAR]